MESYGSGSKRSGGYGSASQIPGGGASSPHNESCLGTGKGGDMGKTGGGAGKTYSDVK